MSEFEFFEWLRSKGISPSTLKDYHSAAQKLSIEECKCKPSCIKQKILRVGTSKQKRVLQNYVTFCEEFLEVIDPLQAKKLRRLLNRVKKEERRLGVESVNLTLNDVEKLSEKLPRSDAKAYLLFAYYSGLRMKEVYFVRDLLLQGVTPQKIEERYGVITLNTRRGAKIATFAFAPLHVFDMLGASKYVSYKNLTKKTGAARLLRKNWYQTCVRVTNYPQLCMFMQGRIADLGVSEEHYYPLFEEAKRYYPRIARALEGSLNERTEIYEILLKHYEILKKLLGTLQ